MVPTRPRPLAALMDLTVDPHDSTPPYEQLRSQLAAAIEAGSLPPGERLPAVRQLASDLGLAAGTVARTYRALESSGLIRTRRGAGTTVMPGAHHLSDAEKSRRLARLADDYVEAARLLGATESDMAAAVTEALEAETPSQGI